MQRVMIDGEKHLLLIVATVFIGSSVGGWAKMLWEGVAIPRGKMAAGIVLSGMAGLIVGMLLWDKLAGNPALLTGVSLLAGIGGASTLEYLSLLLRKIADKLGK